MTIHKLTKSKKAVLTITDDGEVYITSANYLLSLLMGNLKTNFIMTKKMPFSVDPDKFKKSELYIPPGMDEEQLKEQMARQDTRGSQDGISQKAIQERETVKKYEEDEW